MICEARRGDVRGEAEGERKEGERKEGAVNDAGVCGSALIELVKVGAYTSESGQNTEQYIKKKTRRTTAASNQARCGLCEWDKLAAFSNFKNCMQNSFFVCMMDINRRPTVRQVVNNLKCFLNIFIKSTPCRTLTYCKQPCGMIQ